MLDEVLDEGEAQKQAKLMRERIEARKKELALKKV